MKPELKRIIGNYWILFLLILIKFSLQFLLVNPVYELHRDEFLHLDQANHLAFGFISVPPFTSIISKLIFLLGGNLFWVRFFPALFGALTIIFTWLIVESLCGKLPAKLLAGCAMLFSVMVRINILFQPNSFDILIWTVIFYLQIRFLQSGKEHWLYYLAVIAALGLYNKYNLIFLLTGLFLGIVVLRRNLLLQPALWKAALVALILLLPNIIWQAAHHFPVVKHMQALKETQLDHNSVQGFLKGQMLFFMGSIPLIIVSLIAFISFKTFKTYRLIGIAFICTLAIFALLRAKDYYAIGLYPVMLAFGSVYLGEILSGKLKWFIVSLLIGLNLGLFIFTAKLVYPLMSPAQISENKSDFERIGLLRWEDGKNHDLPQDFADMIGWKEMAAKALKAYQMIPDNKKTETLIFCDNYGQTGAINYYNRKKMPEAFSFNTDYIYWLPKMKQIKNVVFVGDKPDEKILEMFSEIKLIGKVENEYAREKGTSIYLFLGANPDFTENFYKLANLRKEKFDIF